MSLKEMSERMKKRATELREDFKGTVRGLEDGLPRPLMNRQTILLREPIIRRLQRRKR
jgi:hypothetical protein